MSKSNIIIGIIVAIVAIAVAAGVGYSAGKSVNHGSDEQGTTSEHHTSSFDSDNQDRQEGEAANEGVSLSEAGKIVTDKYGGTIKGIEDDDYRGTPVWEVEARDTKQGRIEVKVDKKTGEILEVEQD